MGVPLRTPFRPTRLLLRGASSPYQQMRTMHPTPTTPTMSTDTESTQLHSFATRAFFEAIDRGLSAEVAIKASLDTQANMDSFREHFGRAPTFSERLNDA